MKAIKFISILLTISLSFLISCNGCNGIGKKEKKEKITIWQTESDPNARKVLNEIKEDFEKKNNVEINIILNSWGAQVDKLTKAIRTNTLPDIAHIQPFMTTSLTSIDKLEPLDDLFNELVTENGKMFPVAEEIAKHYGTHYGIPYALGITSWSYDSRQCINDFGNAKTWKDFIENSIKSKEKNKDFSVMIPGASAFFMEQLYTELLANNNGKLFDENNQPLFTSKENIETFQFLRDLKKHNLLHPNWQNQTYLDQFTQLAEGNTSCVLVTYARASNTIKEVLKRKSQEQFANDSIFKWMHQPTGPSNPSNHSIATIDCEPWVIFKKKNNSEERLKICKEFLKAYYKKDNYIKFTSQVPIHLTPIFIDDANDPEYLNKTKNWKSWNDNTLAYLNKENGLDVRPILMPDNSEKGKSWNFLLELQYSKILYNNIIKVLTTDEPIEKIANSMQQEAVNFLKTKK